jgi:VanZ family protein
LKCPLVVGVIWLADRGELKQYIQPFVSFAYADKLWHFLLIGILSLLVNLAFMAKRLRISKFNLLLGSLVVTVVVTLEELSQGLLIHRTMDIYDWLADIVGIVLFGQLAVLIVWLIKKPASPDSLILK